MDVPFFDGVSGPIYYRHWAADVVPSLTLQEIAGVRHDVLNETGHRRTAASIANFVLEQAEPTEEEDRAWLG